MDKTLRSGLVVNQKDYEFLLDWKDNNMDIFLFFCETHWIGNSINDFNKKHFDELLEYAKTH